MPATSSGDTASIIRSTAASVTSFPSSRNAAKVITQSSSLVPLKRTTFFTAGMSPRMEKSFSNWVSSSANTIRASEWSMIYRQSAASKDW